MKPANKLKIETLDKGWCDNDIIMLHACFSLLVDCIENKKLLSPKTFDWKSDKQTVKDKVELKALYKWWSKRKKADRKNRINSIDEAQYKEDNEMLTRLILIRHKLWT
jgi:hypothetical protein